MDKLMKSIAEKREHLDARCKENTNPDQAYKVLDMLANGVSVNKICKTVGLDRVSITRLKLRHIDAVREVLDYNMKEMFARTETVGELLDEKLRSLTEKDINDLPIDKITWMYTQLLQQQMHVSDRINSESEKKVESTTSLSDAEEYLNKLKKKISEVENEMKVVEESK